MPEVLQGLFPHYNDCIWLKDEVVDQILLPDTVYTFKHTLSILGKSGSGYNRTSAEELIAQILVSNDHLVSCIC